MEKSFADRLLEVHELKEHAAGVERGLHNDIERMNSTFKRALEDPDFQRWLLNTYAESRKEGK